LKKTKIFRFLAKNLVQIALALTQHHIILQCHLITKTWFYAKNPKHPCLRRGKLVPVKTGILNSKQYRILTVVRQVFKIQISKTRNVCCYLKTISNFDPPPAGMDRNPALLGWILNLLSISRFGFRILQD
jgi:hypothetical protein